MRALLLAILLSVSAVARAAADDFRIGVSGTMPAQCTATPFRVLVDNGVVTVTQYIRCNQPGRYVIRLGQAVRTQWAGTAANHRKVNRSLDSGQVEFNIAAGVGSDETVMIIPRNPAAAREIAREISTQVRL
jgi:hypothetical protein